MKPQRIQFPTRWLIGLIATAFVVGCTPVAWLPDSSGFIYTDGGDFQQLIHYDVAKAERRVIVEKMPVTTFWPALRNDGKQIAVARLVRTADQSKTQTMQVIVYDLQGKEIHRSPELPWTSDGKPGIVEAMPTSAFWGATENQIIVHNFDEPQRTGIYDLAKKSMITLDGIPAAFGGSPVRPDLKGFLVTRKENGASELKVDWVDWNGKTQPIAMKPNAIDNDTKISAIQFPWSGNSTWNGAVAEVTAGVLRIQIDTEKRTGTFEEIPRSEGMVGDKDLLQQFTFAEKSRVRVLGKEDNGSNRYYLEFLKAGEEKPQSIKVQDKNSFVVMPSPDRKWVAVRIVGEEKTIFLINGKGEVKEIAGNSLKAN